jgi:hypothetical protein
MSEQKPQKSKDPPPWWLPIVFGAVVVWLLNNFITIATFVITGVVNLSHVGVGPFLLTLGLSVLFCAIGVIIGIRLCFYVFLGAIELFLRGIGDFIRQLPKAVQGNQSPSPEPTRDDPKTPDPQPPQPTRWDNLRDRVSDIGLAVLQWLLIPKRFRE